MAVCCYLENSLLFLLFSHGQRTSVLEIEEVKLLFGGEGYSNTFSL